MELLQDLSLPQRWTRTRGEQEGPPMVEIYCATAGRRWAREAPSPPVEERRDRDPEGQLRVQIGR